MQDGSDAVICGETVPDSSAGVSDEPTKSINEVLPVEIVHAVLTRHLDNQYDRVYVRAVCVLWASLLPVVKKSVGHHIGFFAWRAATAGHLSLLQWAKAQDMPWKFNITCSCAAAYGHLSVLKWLRAQGCPWGSDTCKDAARGGHLRVLQWAVTNGCTWEADACRRIAAGSNHGHVTAWIDAHTASIASCDTLQPDV
ncbi:Ankyrin repeat domain containing protein [Pandoravirus neocaledonia]|uniref:Ankyrin repeat domain containing protein n=1 Tax=Pandoravirus neocaledonia TaxID=2107708 RepID=A0A2U7UCG6_9VIRU|nr:Ankyrin repeat domain containing protein [Pandoravirus neocaledonia]AVK76117.1 Ankyrin repeat domain containing protein [Pandoravirus neocaledonia]